MGRSSVISSGAAHHHRLALLSPPSHRTRHSHPRIQTTLLSYSRFFPPLQPLRKSSSTPVTRFIGVFVVASHSYSSLSLPTRLSTTLQIDHRTHRIISTKRAEQEERQTTEAAPSTKHDRYRLPRERKETEKVHWKEKGPEACIGKVSTSSKHKLSRLHSLQRLPSNQRPPLALLQINARYLPTPKPRSLPHHYTIAFV